MNDPANDPALLASAALGQLVTMKRDLDTLAELVATGRLAYIPELALARTNCGAAIERLCHELRPARES